MNRLTSYPYNEAKFIVPQNVRGESALRAWLLRLPPPPDINGHRPGEFMYVPRHGCWHKVARCVLYFPCRCEVCGEPITEDTTLCRQAVVADMQIRVYLCAGCAFDAYALEVAYHNRNRL